MTDWDRIIRQHSPEIWTTAYRLVGNRDDAADCLQETYLAAMRLEKTESVGNWRALLHRIAGARALDCLRKRYRDSARLEPTPPDWNILPDSRPDPQWQVQVSEQVQILLESLVKLPELQAEAFCLRYLAELEYGEIAESMKINPNSVGALLSRAKESLRRMLLHAIAPEESRRSDHE